MFNNLKEKVFFSLLKWFCTQRLDQWERWKIKTKYGNVFIDISRKDDGYNYEEIL